MFTKTSYIKRLLRRISLRVFNAVENNGNASFESNGEKLFIDSLISQFSENRDKQRVVFDIGANNGGYSQMIENRSSELDLNIILHLFEPTKSCFSTIFKRFNDNNIILNNFGASDIDSNSKIYYDKEESGLASLYQRNLDSYNLELNQSEEIQLRRLDNYIEEKSIKYIDFIKIDIEGHELKAFEGFGKYLNADFIDYIQFEYGGANLDSHTSLMEIYKFLGTRGFIIAKVMTTGLEVREYKPYMDNFAYSNYVAISKKVLKN